MNAIIFYALFIAQFVLALLSFYILSISLWFVIQFRLNLHMVAEVNRLQVIVVVVMVAAAVAVAAVVGAVAVADLALPVILNIEVGSKFT